MDETFLENLFEHNNWANLQIIQACFALNDEQLDAVPQSATKGSIRRTLLHLVGSQQGYLSLLTVPFEDRHDIPPTFEDLENSIKASGEGLLAVVRNEPGLRLNSQLRTRNGYLVEPWIVIIQVINHATEHREQIKSMLSSLGITPPGVDGWDYGEATHTPIPIPE